MPFVSKQQRAFMHSQHPDIANRWEKEAKAKGVPAVQPGAKRKPKARKAPAVTPPAQAPHAGMAQAKQQLMDALRKARA